MTQEEQNIKHKIENLSESEFADLDMDFDDTDLWNRLETRLDEKKPRKQKPLWLWWAAASLLLGVFFLNKFSENTQSQVLNSETNPIKTTKSTPKKDEVIEKEIMNNYETKVAKLQNEIPLKSDEKLLKEEFLIKKQIDFELSSIDFSPKFDSISVNKKTIVYEPKFKVQQVTIVDFPVIPDELMKRESFAKRAFRQLKSFNTEGKIDWRELNIEPRNVWAYLGRNFKYDSTKVMFRAASRNGK